MIRKIKTLHVLMAGVGAFALAACSSETTTAEEGAAPSEDVAADESAPDPLAAAIAGGQRSDEEKARDQYRHPAETLEFFGVEPDMTVIEVWPGGGWYTRVLAPYLKDEGQYVAAYFTEDSNERSTQAVGRFKEAFSDSEVYGDIKVAGLVRATDEGSEVVSIEPPSSADVVLTFRNVHNWMGAGYSDEMFVSFYDALKPGGVLGVVEHRLPEDRDGEGDGGYVKESAVIRMAEAAGFEFEGKSEVNANPADTADHPFGVWTLPPTSRSANFGSDPDPDFDGSKYAAIGESDRMTLKFRKPLAGDGPALE